METGDILTLVGGLIIVLIIALATNPNYLSSPSAPAMTEPPTPLPTLFPTVLPTPPQIPLETVKPDVEPTPRPVRPDDTPYQIFYTDQPFTYPRFKLPENMVTFGASDIPLRGDENVPFAFVTGTRGGLTRTFSVPYPVWMLNTTVVAERNPQYGNLQLVLCYADNGTVIEGDEILNRGTSYRIVQVSNADMYLIISTAYIDSYSISFETPRNYYETYRS